MIAARTAIELQRAHDQVDCALRHCEIGNFEDAKVYLHAALATIRNVRAELEEPRPMRKFAIVRGPATTPEEIEAQFVSPHGFSSAEIGRDKDGAA